LRRNVLLIAGGPRIDERLARECGLDTGFGHGATGRDVASFMVRRWMEQNP